MPIHFDTVRVFKRFDNRADYERWACLLVGLGNSKDLPVWTDEAMLKIRPWLEYCHQLSKSPTGVFRPMTLEERAAREHFYLLNPDITEQELADYRRILPSIGTDFLLERLGLRVATGRKSKGVTTAPCYELDKAMDKQSFPAIVCGDFCKLILENGTAGWTAQLFIISKRSFD